MKKIQLIFLLAFLFLSFNHSAYGQKKVKEVHYFYKQDAYHLSIKKIEDLKPKHQSRSDIQLMLADCYWNIGDQDKSAKLYQRIARVEPIPIAFQEKYAIAISRFKQKKIEAPKALASKKKALAQEEKKPNNIVQSTADWPIKKQEPIPVKEAVIDVATSVATENSKCNTKCIQVPSPQTFSKAKDLTRAVPVSKAVVAEGKYKIRVGASFSLEDFDLTQIKNLGKLEIREWNNKKIVFVGAYESPESAQILIDQYLKKDYKNAVVVVKRDGRYQSI